MLLTILSLTNTGLTLEEMRSFVTPSPPIKLTFLGLSQHAIMEPLQTRLQANADPTSLILQDYQKILQILHPRGCL